MTYQDVLPAVRLIQSIELAYIVLIIQRRDDENRRVKELFHVCNCKTIRCNMEYDNLINIDRRDISRRCVNVEFKFRELFISLKKSNN